MISVVKHAQMQCKIRRSLCKNCGRKMHDDPRRIIGASYFCKFPIPVSRGNGTFSPTAVSFFRKKNTQVRGTLEPSSLVCLPKTDPLRQYFSIGRPYEHENRSFQRIRKDLSDAQEVLTKRKNEQVVYRKGFLFEVNTEVRRVCQNILGRKKYLPTTKNKKIFSCEKSCENNLRV